MTETDAEFDARMERQFADYVQNGSYEYVGDPNGTYDFGDGVLYVRRKRRQNNKAVRSIIDSFKNAPPEIKRLLKR